jgi:hypothetical protein
MHDAFISYSRKDKVFAARLHKALGNYQPPRDLPLTQRRLDVFRDEDDFTGAVSTSSQSSAISRTRAS